MKRLLLFFALALIAIASTSATNSFVENKGQWHSDVLFLTQMGKLNAWITKQGVVYDFYEERFELPSPFSIEKHRRLISRTGQVVRFAHLYANDAAAANGLQKQSAAFNYLKGNDPAKWVQHVSLFDEAVVNNVYAGIDHRWYFDEGSIRHDYIVHPGADYSQIRFAVQGADDVFVRGNDLVFGTRFGEMKQAGLFVYQIINGRKKAVTASWKLDGEIAGFQIDNYDKAYDLIIDPLLWSTYVGGTASQAFYAVATDNANNTYATGYSASTNYPTTTGAYEQTLNTSNPLDLGDIVVTKMNSTGTALIYSTFIGGNNFEQALAITVDASGAAYVGGSSSSSDYPTTGNAFQSVNSSSFAKGVITKLSANGSNIEYSTYIGGTQNDGVYAISVDASENMFVGGITTSSDFPATAGAAQPAYSAGFDGFVAKLKPSGALDYATYIGGSMQDDLSGIAVDANGNVYASGFTVSMNFPTTAGVVGPTHGDSSAYDGFLVKIVPDGSAFDFATYIGGNSVDQLWGVALDGSGNIYVTGNSASDNFTPTAGAYSNTFPGANFAFVAKLNATATSILYNAQIGQFNNDVARDIAVDNQGRAHITGITFNQDFPTTANAHQQTGSGSSAEAFVTVFNAAGSGLVYSSILGGNDEERGYAIALNGANKAVVAGYTYSLDFPTTANAYSKQKSGVVDGFISCFEFGGATVSTEDLIKATENGFVYPNPNKGTFTIAFSDEAEKEFVVTDTKGEIVMNGGTVQTEKQIVLSNVSEGLYFLHIRKGEMIKTLRFVVIK